MKTTNEILATVSSINLGVIGFITDKETSLTKRKVYNLKLKAVSDSVNVEFSVKIVIIKMSETDTGYDCRAMYRHLTNSQIDGLKAITEQFSELVDSGALEAVVIL
jgi:L-asparaginase/Glu-tRNA(Gln) amidotransferase subunit D